MQAIDFNDGWSYRHLDADESFTAVRLPHDAMIGEPRHEDAPGGVNTGWFDGRDYEYVKTYAPGPELAGRLLLLEFEGVYHNAEVWVDGSQLVFRPYGYTNFRVDLTDALAAGEPHEIRVVARNADQPNSRWYSGAGIYRPVTLWAGDAGHILPDGITVRTVSATPLPADGPADAVKADAVIEASIETTASGTVAIDIIDTSGAVRPGRLCFVRLRYTDANGITKPLERGRITVGVEGGRLLGLGCAAPFNLDSFVSNETGTYYGEALAVVEAPHDASHGDAIVLTAADATGRTTTLTVPVG